MEFVSVEELLDKNLLAELPTYHYDGTPTGTVVKVRDGRLEEAVSKCNKYLLERGKIVGTWKVNEDENGLMYVTCSLCGKIPNANHISQYCPNCGGKMKGVYNQ